MSDYVVLISMLVCVFVFIGLICVIAEHTKRKEESPEQRTNKRLGLSLDTSDIDVDADMVPLLAKIMRVIGMSGMIGFVAWGLFYDWNRYSPFGAFVNGTLGVPSSDIEGTVYLITGVILVAGWFFRFIIGNTLFVIVLTIMSGIKKLFKLV